MDAIKLTWLGHSCFRLEKDGYAVLLDPYSPGSVPGLAPLHETVQAVLCSHDHADHTCPQGIDIVPGPPSPFTLRTVDCFHDEVQGAKRGKNRIHILSAAGLTVVHLGDLGHPLSPQEIAAVGPVDALLIPVGGYYTIDGETAAAVVGQLRPRVVIPMHYRGRGFGYEEIGTVEPFLAKMEGVVRFGTNTLTLTRTTPPQTAVLHCPAEA